MPIHPATLFIAALLALGGLRPAIAGDLFLVPSAALHGLSQGAETDLFRHRATTVVR